MRACRISHRRYGLSRLAVGMALVAAGIGTSVSAMACPTAGLELPAGFCATVFAERAGQPRALAVGRDGTVFANLNDGSRDHDLVALIDDDHDGRADRRIGFGQGGATGLVRHGHWLYSAATDGIWRYRLPRHGAPQGPGQRVVRGLPAQPRHSPIGLAVDDSGHLYVAIAALSNACQKNDRRVGQRGRDPCPELRRYAGVWRFAADRPDQAFDAGTRYASGLRSLFALAWQTSNQRLVGLTMGRDQLHDLWPGRYTPQQSSEQPAETLYHVAAGGRYGWPYCYYDGLAEAYRLNPEYGGNGRNTSSRCAGLGQPMAHYPAHWAPMAIVFYHDRSFPAAYRSGAFIAFHGSWDRSPAPQAGFQVVFQAFDKTGQPTHGFQTFAGPRGFTGHGLVRASTDAAHRPSGLAVGPKGALYVADDQDGTIYRIRYGE